VQRALAVPVGLATADYLQGLEGAAGPRARRASSWPPGRARRRTDQLAAENHAPARPAGPAPALQVRTMRPKCCTRRPTRIRARSSSTAAQRRAWWLGSPVINEAGVLGPGDRLYPLTSEVTLLTDRTPRFRC
jgi:hypothetical protein